MANRIVFGGSGKAKKSKNVLTMPAVCFLHVSFSDLYPRRDLIVFNFFKDFFRIMAFFAGKLVEIKDIGMNMTDAICFFILICRAHGFVYNFLLSLIRAEVIRLENDRFACLCTLVLNLTSQKSVKI